MTETHRPLAATLDEAAAAMRGFMDFLNETQADAQSGDPSRRLDMDAVQKAVGDWTSRLRGLAAELAAARAAATGAAAGEAALAECVLAMSSQGTPTATAADIIGNLGPDDPCFERWVVGTDATRLVFGCIYMAEGAAGATQPSDFVERIAKSHPHPLVRAPMPSTSWPRRSWSRGWPRGSWRRRTTSSGARRSPNAPTPTTRPNWPTPWRR